MSGGIVLKIILIIVTLVFGYLGYRISSKGRLGIGAIFLGISLVAFMAMPEVRAAVGWTGPPANQHLIGTWECVTRSQNNLAILPRLLVFDRLGYGIASGSNHLTGTDCTDIQYRVVGKGRLLIDCSATTSAEDQQLANAAGIKQWKSLLYGFTTYKLEGRSQLRIWLVKEDGHTIRATPTAIYQST